MRVIVVYDEAGAESCTIVPARVFTAHGTVLYIDETLGLLSDGDLDASPENLVLAIDGLECQLMYKNGQSLQAMSLRPDHHIVISKQEGAGSALTPALSLEIVGLSHQKVAFKHNRLFLSAQKDGVIRLLKDDCRDWEVFRIERPAPARGSLHGYSPDLTYLFNIDQVEGWLSDTTAAVIHRLLRNQIANKIHGHTLEIGIHHGRLFLLLATGLGEAERAVAVDIFEDQHLNESFSGHGNRLKFERAIKQHAPNADIEIIKANSMDLGENFIRSHAGMRFISIDGGHTRDITCNDLHIAERLLVSGGIVALDDIYKPTWSGVTAGLHKYYTMGGGLVPFALTPNKVLFSSDRYYSRDYAALIREEFAYAITRVPSFMQRQQFFDFDEILFCP